MKLSIDMKRNAILFLLRDKQAELQSLGVESLAVFGSVARDEASSGSDIDILVTFRHPITFDSYMDVKIFLEDLTNCSIDLVIADSISPRIKPLIQQDVVYVA
jgi:predicted nucleotidyltransferase